MSIFKNIVGGIDHFANSINPMKQPMQWLTDNTIGKIPGNVGRLGSQTYDYSNSHPLESLAAMAAIYGGASYLGAGAAGGAGGAGAAGAGAGEGGAGLGSGLGTASGFGGVGTDAGVAGFGAGGADAGGVAAADGAAPAASSSFDWQSLARQALSSQLKSQGGSSSGGQYQPMAQQAYPDQGGQQQKMAMALMQPYAGAPYLPASQLSNSALAAYLMPKANSQQLYQSAGNNPSRNANSNADPLGSTGSNYEG